MHSALEMVIRRLRSGAVKQIDGKLGLLTGERCCLGVICDIAVEYGVIPPPVPVKNTLLTGETEYILAYDDDSTVIMPTKVRDFFGFTNVSGAYNRDYRSNFDDSLMNDNDSKGLTFEQIADIIESRPKGLFVEPPTSSPAS